MTRQSLYRLLAKVTKERKLKWYIRGRAIRVRNRIERSCPISACHPERCYTSDLVNLVGKTLRLSDHDKAAIVIASDVRMTSLTQTEKAIRRAILRACGLEKHRYA